MKKSISIVFATMAILLCAMATVSYGGWPEPPTDYERLNGPAMVGTMIITLGQDSSGVPAITQTVTVKVKGKTKTGNLYITETSGGVSLQNWFYGVTRDGEQTGIEGMRLESSLASDLQDPADGIPGGTLIVNTVTSYAKTDTVIIADVVILYVVPK